MNKDKKTQLLYLGKHRETTVRHYVDNYRKLLELIDETTLIYMQLVKADAISFNNDASHNQT